MSMGIQLSKEAFTKHILQQPVLDTHTHLVGDRLAAGDFWEVAHYFWLFREMQAAGYPAGAMELPEDLRISAFLDAYQATRNTLMNIAFTHILKDLYGITLSDKASVLEADRAIKQSAQRADWAQEVANRMQARRFVVNIPEHAEFQGMAHNAILIPRIDGKLGAWVKDIEASSDRAAALADTRAKLGQLLDAYKKDGVKGIMTTLPSYKASANHKVVIGQDSTKDEILMMLLHEIGAAAEQRGLLVQLFLGVERSWCGTAVPVNDPERILKLSALFEAYACPFELVVASELNNLDIVQAAWNFPNVHVGGHWWFNFRASTYRDSMQYRLEALPAIKSSLIVSDARCMEWSYGKIIVIKRLVGEFLWNQIEAGWIDQSTALQIAEDWLYRSAAKRYGVEL
ncbi:glucuronate isomerase [Paenibacillus chondroitinus]|uniref:Glucuronate isomerase n=1 Tax=Paenibacillus chondroitinus TaxID=59842 RepID=A0ABU6DNP8_9BACL|nr:MULTISPECIES: glucuronate isomerase [Paenibacillus]MCY9658050.1 glucuronate isomerase [Paenibacillus anseongense]MEB4798950.1 glucuronate isomerase [Paenibacillus chondroitinus]